MIYTRKYPGNPSMSDITLSRGVARGDGTFWRWLRLIMEGADAGPANEYRADIDIQHFHRDSSLVRAAPASGGQANKTDLNIDSPARTYHIKEAFAIRHKVAGDLDATASEISIMELDLSYEHFEVEEHAAPA
jgi:phage tail-like protein